ncbi:hypothetical protein Tco_0397744 [Tanacetum coccineum]
MELVLEQTQQGTSYEVSVSAEGVEELKRKVKIKGEKKEALLTLRWLRRNTVIGYAVTGSIPINRGLIQAIPTSLPPQPIGEATKASNLQRIPHGVQGRSHFTYFLYLIVQIRILWVDRLAPGTINTWDLLKKAFIQRYCTPSLTAKQLEDIHNFKQEGDESLYQAWERYNDLPYKCPTHDINNHQKVNIFYKGLSTMNRQLLDSQGPIPRMRPAQALTAIQTMADHSQKWHDGTTSRNIRSSSSKDGLAALVNKLDNLGRDMKKLKESVHAIQVGCQICEGPHLDKDCPLNEEVKQVKEETSGPNKLHRVSFISGTESNTPKVLPHQLPPKELNPGSFTLPYTIGKFNFYAMADLGASINVMPRSIFEHLHLTNLKKTNMLCEIADMSKKPSCDPDKKMCDGGVEICRVSKTGNLRFWYCNYDNERRNIKGKGLSFPDFLFANMEKSKPML